MTRDEERERFEGLLDDYAKAVLDLDRERGTPITIEMVYAAAVKEKRAAVLAAWQASRAAARPCCAKQDPPCDREATICMCPEHLAGALEAAADAFEKSCREAAACDQGTHITWDDAGNRVVTKLGAAACEYIHGDGIRCTFTKEQHEQRGYTGHPFKAAACERCAGYDTLKAAWAKQLEHIAQLERATAGLDRESVARALHLTNDQDTWQWGEWTTDEYGLEFYRNWADRFLAAQRGTGE